VSLPARPRYAQVLRERLRAWLAEVGIEGDVAGEVVSACSEAFNNAVLHPVERADDVIDIGGERMGSLLRVSFQDHGRWRAQPRAESGGFGVLLTRSLMDEVHVHRSAKATTVVLERML
jgi:anti-sigma regulatory factor (Ser/Thr protein kinase)